MMSTCLQTLNHVDEDVVWDGPMGGSLEWQRVKKKRRYNVSDFKNIAVSVCNKPPMTKHNKRNASTCLLHVWNMAFSIHKEVIFIVSWGKVVLFDSSKKTTSRQWPICTIVLHKLGPIFILCDSLSCSNIIWLVILCFWLILVLHQLINISVIFMVRTNLQII